MRRIALIAFGVVLFLTRSTFFAGQAGQQETGSVINAVAKSHPVGQEQVGLEAVRAALAAGGNVNEQDSAGWTPLMYAALECRAAILKLLIDSGAEVNTRSKMTGTRFPETGQTPLLIASGCFIARRRAQLGPERHMPPDYASYELSAPEKMVDELLAHGASPNASDSLGRTPLMMAAMHDWPAVVRELLQAHAAVNARDKEDRLAIDYADPSQGEIVSYLRKNGSQPATGHSGRAVCDVQGALARMGFLEPPVIDCIAGDQFTTTLKHFQKQHALEVSGELDQPTVRALGMRN